MGLRQKPKIPIGSPNVSQFIKKSSFPSFFVSVFFSSLVGIWLFCNIRISPRYLCQPRVLRLYLEPIGWQFTTFGKIWNFVWLAKHLCYLCIMILSYCNSNQSPLLIIHKSVSLSFFAEGHLFILCWKYEDCRQQRGKVSYVKKYFLEENFFFKIFSNMGDAILSSFFKDSVKTVVVWNCFLSFAFVYCLHLSCMD